MKSVKEYKEEIINLIIQMEKEQGIDIEEIRIYVTERAIDEFSEIIDKEYKVVVKY